MANLIATIEDALLARCRAIVPGLKTYDYAPAEWDGAIANQLLAGAPAIYVAFLGYRKREGYFQGPKILKFGLYCLTANGPEPDRRRGDEYAAGAYDIALAIDGGMDGYLLQNDCGNNLATLSVEDCQNLFTVQLWDLGGTCYALNLEMPIEIVDLHDCTYPLIDVHTDWDIAAFSTSADHARWMADDTSAPAPDGQSPKAQDDTALEGFDG